MRITAAFVVFLLAGCLGSGGPTHDKCNPPPDAELQKGVRSEFTFANASMYYKADEDSFELWLCNDSTVPIAYSDGPYCTGPFTVAVGANEAEYIIGRAGECEYVQLEVDRQIHAMFRYPGVGSWRVDFKGWPGDGPAFDGGRFVTVATWP